MFSGNPSCVIESGPIVVRREFGKEFRINNPRRKSIRVCKVDDGLIRGNSTKKCDYLFVLDCANVETIVLVELKGIDHIKAVEQLVATAEQLNIKSAAVKAICYIVGSSNPKLQTNYQKELVRMSGRYNKACLKLPVRLNNSATHDWL